jgi:hypothetical protein
MAATRDMRDLARLSRAEVMDGMQVLSRGALAKRLEPGILLARIRLLAARVALEGAQLLRSRKGIDALLSTAMLHLRAARLNLADPTTLPPSFRN